MKQHEFTDQPGPGNTHETQTDHCVFAIQLAIELITVRFRGTPLII